MGALYEAVKDAQDSETGIMYPPIAAGAGKFDLGSGRTSGLVVRLNSPWQIEFLGSGQRTIDGGILVGGLGNQPVYLTTNTQIVQNRPADAFIVASSGSGGGSGASIDSAEVYAAVKAAIQSELSKIYVPTPTQPNTGGPVTAALIHSRNGVNLVQVPSSGTLVNAVPSEVKNPFN